MSFKILQGDCLDVLRTMPDESVQCCVTSPPYWGLRDYGVAGQLGLERTPEDYVAKMVEGFREVRRVLRKDGTLWLNLGDSYCANRGNTAAKPGFDNKAAQGHASLAIRQHKIGGNGIKEKDLVGIPWMVAFALRADGWYLRQDIIWSKPNPMPESVTDRCTKAHEYLFLLSKSERYYCDMEAIKEASVYPDDNRKGRQKQGDYDAMMSDTGQLRAVINPLNPTTYPARNKRSVWEITTSPFPEAHFATFPPKLVEPCILAGSKEGDTVLDPFNGAGTTGLVATRLQRNYIGIELNADYVEMAKRRIEQDQPLFNTVEQL